MRSIKERLEEVKDEKASLEKLAGFEERIADKLGAIEQRIGELKEDIQLLKKN